MKIFLLFLLCLQALSFLIPVQTGSHRCMVVYSINHEDTIKITMKFPQDRQIQQFYDYTTYIKDLNNNIIMQQDVKNYIFKTEILVPNQTIYEACVHVRPNHTKSGNASKYQGEVLIDYEANTHFILDQVYTPYSLDMIRDEEIDELTSQAKQVINATQQYIKIQKNKQVQSVTEFQGRKERGDTLFEWWMLELIVIILIAIYQWAKMKKRIEINPLQF